MMNSIFQSLLFFSLYCLDATAAFTPLLPTQKSTSLSSRRARHFALNVVADAEKEDTRHNNNKNDTNNEKTSPSQQQQQPDWVPTAAGNFLPNLKNSKIRQRLMRLGPQTLPGVTEVTSLQEYKDVVADEPDRLVCVRFYAPWCRACKAIAKPFARLSKLYPDIKLVQVPTTKDNALLHQGLGVPSLPYCHLYHPEVGLVEERKISKEYFDEFKNKILKSYVEGFCPVEYDDDNDQTSDSILQ